MRRMSRSPREYFAGMPAAFKPEAAAGMNAVYQFDLSGNEGGKWYVRVRQGLLEVGEGIDPSPDVTLRAAAGDYVDIAEGRMNPVLALMTGKFKLEGNMALALKLQSIFKPARTK